MNWNKEEWDIDLFNSYKKLINIVNEYEVVKNGEFRWLNNNNLLSFKRFNENEEIYIYINNSERKVKISLKSTNDCVNLFNDDIVKKHSKIQLLPGEFKIFKI